MKARLSYILIGILLLPLSLCTSCSVADDVDLGSYEGDGGTMLVSFSLDVKSQSATRASDNYLWDDNYPSIAGEGDESKINPLSILVFAYKKDGTFVAQLPILLNTEGDNGNRSILCAFPKSTPYLVGETYRFMVLANCVSSNYGISYDANDVPNIEDLIFSAPFNGPIPMWGVTSYKIPTEKPVSNEFELGNISMLRATAKVGVKLSDELLNEGYRIKGIKLNYANASGYCAPKGWNTSTSTVYLEHLTSFRPYNAGQITDLNAVTMSAKNPGCYYMYVPETENSLSNELSIAVTLKKVDGDVVVKDDIIFPYEKGIRFCNYDSNGKPTTDIFNIIRNHFYDYTITAINLGLKMNLVVAEWEDEPVWNLDFSAPIHTNLMTAPSTTADAPTIEPTMYRDNTDETGEKGAFVGYFMMESPEGMTWRPTLANASSTDYEVRVYKTNTLDDVYNVLVTDPAISAERNYFYKIVVVPLNSENVNNVIKLGLTYTASWNQEATPLLIINKGENNGLYYPWDGTASKDAPDIHWISIRQVEPPQNVQAD